MRHPGGAFANVLISDWLPAQFYGITIYVNVTAGNMAACFMPLRLLRTARFSIFSQNCCMFMCCAFILLFHMVEVQAQKSKLHKYVVAEYENNVASVLQLVRADGFTKSHIHIGLL